MQRRWLPRLWLWAAFGACAQIARAPRDGREALYTWSHLTMGTLVSVSVWTGDEAGARRAAAAAFSEFDRLERLMSTWIAASDTSRLNAAAGRVAVRVSPEMMQVLAAAKRLSADTGGIFDVTFGALTPLWKFDHDQDNVVPDEAAIARARALVGHEGLVLDAGRETAFLARAGMKVHLGGIGKGFAVDRAVDVLRRAGFLNFIVQAGGDLYAAGRRDGQAWRAGVRDPRAADFFATLSLSDMALSTSGDYERYFIKDGVRYHHLIDLRTGHPARASRSASVVAATATLADGLTKAAFVLGGDEGRALVERLGGRALIVGGDNRVVVSRTLKDALTMRRPPTDAPKNPAPPPTAAPPTTAP